MFKPLHLTPAAPFFFKKKRPKKVLLRGVVCVEFVSGMPPYLIAASSASFRPSATVGDLTLKKY